MNELFAKPTLEPETHEPDTLTGALFPEMASPAPPPAEAAQHYRVLARKYRPTTFEQLIGQEAMVRTLTNAIEAKRLPHAWMLTGVRGIGKTTTARIIARALNCTGAEGKNDGPTIKPCGVCDTCRSIMEDRHVDVLEMDAASRTGVDDIRDIIDGVRYGPASARYKVYVLDEVHMLSKNAFNALLKTLEEPPPHTKFIFATTEIRKVPVTVLSRCQRFDLRRIDSEQLAKHFADIATCEQSEAEAEAIKLIARAADGSVRDGLSLLDQAIARGNGKVTTEDVKDMLGLADRGHGMALCRQVLRGEMRDALATLATMQQAGSDSLQILQDLCDAIHLLTRGQVIPDYAQGTSLPEYDRQLLMELADIKIPALTRAWQILLKGIGEVQQAPHADQAAEMVLIRLAYASELPPPGDLIRQIKETMASGVGSATSSAPTGGGGPVARAFGGGSAAFSQAVSRQSLPAAQPEAEAATAAHPSPTTFRELIALFSEMREGALHAQLYGQAQLVRCEPGKLEVHFASEVPANFAGRVGQCLSTWTGVRWMVSIANAAGEATLAEQEKAAEQTRRDRAMAHPLMKAVLENFPGAKLVNLTQRSVAPTSVTSDDDVSLPDDVSPLELED
ncbi:MAG: DNA polymerase III subunit gamma/tau [Bdellovibrionales bacterium]